MTLGDKIYQLRKERDVYKRQIIFFHPDYTVGPGVSPGQRLITHQPVADFTASGDLHPALKTKIQLFSGCSIRRPNIKCKPEF